MWKFVYLIVIFTIFGCVAVSMSVSMHSVETYKSKKHTLVDLKSRQNITSKMRYTTFIDNEKPKAVLLMFAGGNGFYDFDKEGNIQSKLKGNFLVRTESLFRGKGYAVAYLDSPSDVIEDFGGELYHFRTSYDHVQDIEEAVLYLKRHFNRKVILVGTSRGAISALAAETKAGKSFADAVILTSSVTEENKKGDNVTMLNSEDVKKPVLVAHNKGDKCKVTPVESARKLSKSFTMAPVSTYIEVDSDLGSGRACGGKSAHGFFGIENEVVSKIDGWISSKVLR
jgi:hypothetical protein